MTLENWVLPELMPIYTDDDTDNGYDYLSELYYMFSCEEILNAFFQIYEEAKNIVITPFVAQYLIKNIYYH